MAINSSEQQVADLDYLRSLEFPKVLYVEESSSKQACDGILSVINTSDLQTTFRVHPFPEELNKRRSVREHECAYLPATITQFNEWMNNDEISNDNPFHEYCPRDQFWAYCDYKEVKDVVHPSSYEGIFSWDMMVATSDNEEMGTFSDSKIWIVSF